jgi:sulfite reductase beta subunit-like hemoprotein
MGTATTTATRARLSFAETNDIDVFVETLGRYERGEITPDEWKAFRLVRGTYGQRQTDDAQMLRVKIPQGVLDGPQMHALADVAESWSRGFGHVTTRQNLQFHFMRLADVEHAMRRLAAAGLTTREACGNSVRTITACSFAGVAADEPFDVTPYAEALTRYLLRHPLSSSLPRKFKVAFEGCRDDHVFAAINDLGWHAQLRVRDGVAERGFRVTVGGGTAILCRSGFELFEFLPVSQMLAVAEAVLRVFHTLGDRQHRQRNRMKFLIQQMGWATWRQAFDASLAAVREEGIPPLPDELAAPAEESAPVRAAMVPRGALPLRTPAHERWLRTNVRPQKQRGYAIVRTTLPLGDVTGAQLRLLADAAAAYGDGTARATHLQDFVLRWVRHEDLAAVHALLDAGALGQAGAGTLQDVTSCPGAETCRIAVTRSRGLGQLLGDHLRARPDLVDAVPGLDIKISGCPNGCGQHHIAGLGFQGSVRKLGNRVVPQYFVTIGGRVDTGGARFGRLVAKVPARRVPQVVERLVALYTAEKDAGETPVEFLRRVDAAQVKALLADLERLGAEDAVEADFVDLGDLQAFKVETLEGECMA